MCLGEPTLILQVMSPLYSQHPSATATRTAEPDTVFTCGLQALPADVQQPFEKVAALFSFRQATKLLFRRQQTHVTLHDERHFDVCRHKRHQHRRRLSATKAQEFNERMVSSYISKKATYMMTFLATDTLMQSECYKLHSFQPMF